MKKGLWLLAALAVSSAVCAQENGTLGREDVLAAFKEYNPSALEKAALHPAYNDLLNKVAASYAAPNTDENQNELIALVKNFDNSVRLQAAKEEYFDGRTLQAVSGEELAALDGRVFSEIREVVQSVFDNTLAVRQIQIDRYKAQIKAVKKDDALSKEQKKQTAESLKDRIKAVKTEIKNLKKNSKQKIQDTALVYFADIRTEYAQRQEAQLLSAQQRQLQAVQSSIHDVKAKNKKPVAK